MFKLVKCIKPSKYLTEGKYYKVDFETENAYRIKDDKGNFPTYNKRRFIDMSERLDEILTELLVLDGNETNLINRSTYEYYKSLVIAVTRATKNIRYCNRAGCTCHPEYTIILLLNDEDLVKFLNKYNNSITTDLIEWCNNYVL